MNGTGRTGGLSATLFSVMLWGQGLFYIVTAVWPLVSIESFEAVTGPKTDDWLVMTVAALITAVGLALLVAAWRRSHTPEIVVLAVAAAVGLMSIDLIYVPRGIIPSVYLLDALAEALLLLGWGVVGVVALLARKSETKSLQAVQSDWSSSPR